MTIDEIKKWMLESSGFPVTQANAEYLERFQAIAFKAGAASRDAEIQRLQMALADAEALELGTAEKCDQLRAQINVLREALSSAESALDESRDYPVTYDGVITALITTHEQSLAEYRNKVIEQMIACYSPDDSAHDYFDKLNALKGQS